MHPIKLPSQHFSKHFQAPTVEDVVMFVEKVPPYDLDATCSPFQYWKSIMSDTPVAQVFFFLLLHLALH